MTKKNFLIFALFFSIPIIYCYFYLDTNLILETQDIRTNYYVILKILSILISPPTLLVIFTTIFAWALFIQKSKKIAEFYFPLVYGLIMTNAFIRIIKVIFGRSRPDHFLTDGVYQFHLISFDRYFSSFPSGHAASIGSLMGFLACTYPKKAFWIILIGLSLSFVRVFIGAHYMSDVLIGDFIGFYITCLCYYKCKSNSYLYYAEKKGVK